MNVVVGGMSRYLHTDNFVPWLGAVNRGVVTLLSKLLPGTGLPLGHRVDGLQMGGVGQHGHMNRVSRSKVQIH